MTSERARLIVRLWDDAAPQLRSWLRSQAGADGEDMTTDTFVRLMTLDDALPTEELVWTIALGHLTDYRRKQGRAACYSLDDDAGREGYAKSFATEDASNFRADFDRAFRSLPREQQEAFALTDLRGLTQHEAAEVLEIDQATVSRRAVAARTYLKEHVA